MLASLSFLRPLRALLESVRLLYCYRCYPCGVPTVPLAGAIASRPGDARGASCVHKLLKPRGSKELLLGNEAVARGALEAGVSFAAAYPGTPSTEIVESLAQVASEVGMHVEWSVNEKVAYESAYAASLAGVRALAAMKHVGVNVASDILVSSCYCGTRAGFVVVSADDPSMHSSQNEQDSRWYGFLARIPVVEPWSPRSAYELVKEAYELSERYSHPVMLRLTTRVCHTRQPVEYQGDVKRVEPRGSFTRDPERFVLTPANARRLKKVLSEKWSRIAEEVWKPFVEVENPGRREAVIAAGVAYSYASEALDWLGLRERVTLVRLSLTVPLPRRLLKELEGCERVLVVEELDPVVEMQLRSEAQKQGLDLEILGKELVPLNYELDLASVAKAVAEFLGEGHRVSLEHVKPLRVEVPPRPPVMCAGCPHRLSFFVIREALKRAGIPWPVFCGDIGCYTLGYLPPFRMQDTVVEMGGSVGLAHGFSIVLDEPVVAVAGDSTFYHACMPGALNVVYNRGRALLVVLDNLYTAMTGHQPHPGTGVTATGEPAERVPAERILESMGYEVYVVNPLLLEKAIAIVEDALKNYAAGARVALVFRMKCALQAVREARRKGIQLPLYAVDESKCTGCGLCARATACPAIRFEPGSKPQVIPEVCVGCGLCSYVCPSKAIVKVREGSPGWEEVWTA